MVGFPHKIYFLKLVSDFLGGKDKLFWDLFLDWDGDGIGIHKAIGHLDQVSTDKIKPLPIPDSRNEILVGIGDTQRNVLVPRPLADGVRQRCRVPASHWIMNTDGEGV
jgi:hypothetical protein